jgi:hypothetical protein
VTYCLFGDWPPSVGGPLVAAQPETQSIPA